MTDKMIAVPKELLEELRDFAELCADDVRAHDLGEDSAEAEFRQVGRACDALLREAALQSQDREGWKEAAIAWEVCASIHREWAKGKDALFNTRQADFTRHAEEALAAYRNQGDGK